MNIINSFEYNCDDFFFFFFAVLSAMKSYDFDFSYRVRDRIPLAEMRKGLPFIYFITPTYRRPTQKADLIRLAQTLGMLLG